MGSLYLPVVQAVTLNLSMEGMHPLLKGHQEGRMQQQTLYPSLLATEEAFRSIAITSGWSTRQRASDCPFLCFDKL